MTKAADQKDTKRTPSNVGMNDHVLLHTDLVVVWTTQTQAAALGAAMALGTGGPRRLELKRADWWVDLR